MPQALKASWEVHAGVIPGQRRAEYSKYWEYLSSDAEEDRQIEDPSVHAKFSKLRAEAMDYYLQVSLPALNNWATITFVWY